MGRSLFTGRDIVPERLQGRPAWMQYTDPDLVDRQVARSLDRTVTDQDRLRDRRLLRHLGAGPDGVVVRHRREFADGEEGRRRVLPAVHQGPDKDLRGRPAFNADVKRLHPLQRAYDANTVLTAIGRDLASNTLTARADKSPLRLDPDTRRDLFDTINDLNQTEMRNAPTLERELVRDGSNA